MKLLKTIADKKDESFRLRNASRAILFDENGLIPILFVSKENYHKLPGGGMESGENKISALKREVKEETGCKMEVEGVVGKIIEYRSKFKLKQVSYCYHGKVVSRGMPKLEQGEIDEGFKLVWFTLNDAVVQLRNDKPKNYEGKFIQDRDLTFLVEAQKTLKVLK